jgi:uncharacterized tellurite resistance protein B-like protein
MVGEYTEKEIEDAKRIINATLNLDGVSAVEIIEQLQKENRELKSMLKESVDWNWLDYEARGVFNIEPI